MGDRVYWTGPVPPLSFADGPTASTAALVDITPGTEPSQILPVLERGTRIRIKADGWCTSGSATPTLIMGIYLAPVATLINGAGVVSWVTTTTALPASVTQGPWDIIFEGECRALSTPASATAGQIRGRGFFHPVSSLTALGTPQAIPAVYANRNVSVNTTIAYNVLIGATLSAVTGSPQVACEHVTVELIG